MNGGDWKDQCLPRGLYDVESSCATSGGTSVTTAPYVCVLE